MLALALAGVNELALLFGGGALVMLARARRPPALAAGLAAMLALPGAALGQGVAAAGGVTLGTLFVTFLKIGATLYGSGYVLLAFLRNDFVHRLHWLTDRQLLDAIAVGQVTPGPVFTTATFLGYVLAGGPGAALATVAIFLPSFVFVALSHPLLPRIRGSRWAGAFLDGVNVAALGLMAAVTLQLARSALVDVVHGRAGDRRRCVADLARRQLRVVDRGWGGRRSRRLDAAARRLTRGRPCILSS